MNRNSPKKPVTVIFAPTASGKTALMRELFSPSGSHFLFNAEIISADSMQVYKGMDIGTAKPSPEFCAQIPHHLINLVEPSCQFSVADFITYADKAYETIICQGNQPVVCGGTGFYIRSFLYGLPETPQSNENIRNQLKQRLELEGNAPLYEELKAVDPESAEKIHLNDAYRILRALEVFYTTGKKRSDYKIENTLRPEYDFLFIVLEPPRELLFNRIEQRVEQMFFEGLENEVKALIESGCNKDTPGMKAIGYREWFLHNNIDDIKASIIKNSIKYAKKQFTYIRDIPGSIILPYDASENAVKSVGDVIKNHIFS